MGRRPMYTRDKVLYFASRDNGLHVDIDEHEWTDLATHVYELHKDKHIEVAAKDDSGTYYKITRRGRIHLLKMQIEWRSQNGKNVDEHWRQLRELQSS